MTTGPEHLLILGVRHPDRRVPGLVKEHVEEPVDKVFHESPESDTSTATYVAWTIIKNPLAVFVGTRRILALLISNLRFVVRMVLSGKADNLTLKKEGHAQGRRAARMLSENYGIEWEPVDMNRVEMLRSLPAPLSLSSWVVVICGLLSFSLLFIVPLAGALLMVGSFGFALVVKTAVGDQRRPARDERMFQNIIGASDSGDYAVLITGENHVQGVASRAAASSIEYDVYWLSSTADITDKSE